MNMETISGLLRHLLTFGGGFMVERGIATEAHVTAGVAAIVTLFGIIWSIYNKNKADGIVALKSE